MVIDLNLGKISDLAQHNMTLCAFAAWPLVALLITTATFSDFRGAPPLIPVLTCLCFLFGGLLPWSFSGMFSFDLWKGSVGQKVIVQILVFLACLIFCSGCIAIKRRIHLLKPKQKHIVILNCFTTVAYSMLPIVYLSLESIGSIVHRKDKNLSTYSRDIAKVNFIACLHILGMACYQILFAPYSRYKAKDILKGKFDRLVGLELIMFIASTTICLFLLATKLTDDSKGDISGDYMKQQPVVVLEEMHRYAAYIFGWCWFLTFVSNTLKFMGYFGGNSLSKKKRKTPKGLKMLQDRLRLIVADIRGSRSGTATGVKLDTANECQRNTETRSRQSVSDASTLDNSTNSLRGLFNLSSFWRISFSVVPLIVMPGITLTWIIMGPKSAPYAYLYLAFEPLNLLSSYVVLFSSPGDERPPLLEIAVYIIGGPIVLIGGEVRTGS